MDGRRWVYLETDGPPSWKGDGMKSILGGIVFLFSKTILL